MRIDAITVCVGSLYLDLFKQTLPAKLDTLDSLTIVTKPGDPVSKMVKDFPSVRVVETDVFTQRKAHFNKGAALNVAFAAASPISWALSIDADIELPSNWRELAEPQIECGKLYGAVRDSSHTKFFLPYGYFQLWCVEDSAVRGHPLFTESYSHCGRYDTEFMIRWKSSEWKDLGFKIRHLGEPCHYWFGEGENGRHLMSNLLRGGVSKYRRRDEKLC